MGRNTKAVNVSYFLKLVDILIKSRKRFYDCTEYRDSILEMFEQIREEQRIEEFIVTSIQYGNFPTLDYLKLPYSEWTLYQRIVSVCFNNDIDDLLKLNKEIVLLLRDDELFKRTQRIVKQNTYVLHSETIVKFAKYLEKRNKSNEVED